MRLGLSFLTFAVAMTMSVNCALADLIGTLGISALSAGSADTGDISTADEFSTGSLFSVIGSGTGDFAGYPDLDPFGSVTFKLSDPTSFTLSSSNFGSFVSSSISVISNSGVGSGHIVGIYILGNYTAGAGNYVSGSGLASITITFNQTGGPNTAITDSATFAIPPSPVPEPSTAALAALGISSLGFAAYRRRTTKA